MNVPLEECIINLAKHLNITEQELVDKLKDEFQNDENYQVLDDLWWEFN